MWDVKRYLKRDATSKDIQPPLPPLLCSFWTFLVSRIKVQTRCLIKMLYFFGLGKLCCVNVGLNSKGIAMSTCIGQAMHYTVIFFQSPEFKIYKCLTVFSEWIAVKEMDVFRHQYHSFLWMLKKRSLFKVHCASRTIPITPEYAWFSFFLSFLD